MLIQTFVSFRCQIDLVVFSVGSRHKLELQLEEGEGHLVLLVTLTAATVSISDLSTTPWRTRKNAGNTEAICTHVTLLPQGQGWLDKVVTTSPRGVAGIYLQKLSDRTPEGRAGANTKQIFGRKHFLGYPRVSRSLVFSRVPSRASSRVSYHTRQTSVMESQVYTRLL